MKSTSLRSKSINELLALHSAALEELKSRKVLRSKNNPTGDYAEWLVSQKLALTLETNSSKGYDAVDRHGLKYQIKGRRVAAADTSTMLGVIRNLEGCDFDYLVAVIFDEVWQVKYAAQIAHKDVMALAKFRAHVNGHAVVLRESCFDNRRIKDITGLLRP